MRRAAASCSCEYSSAAAAAVSQLSTTVVAGFGRPGLRERQSEAHLAWDDQLVMQSLHTKCRAFDQACICYKTAL